MIPYELRKNVQDLYTAFSHKPYDPKISGVLPNVEFVLNPLFQSVKQEFLVEYVKEDKPFILAGPEFNNL
jgi:hypothetical protein